MLRWVGLVMLCLALGCRPGASSESPEVGPPLPSVDREDPSFAGTWVGPEFMLSFVGEWVLIRPSDDPELAPIELRVTIERAEGDAFALQTSLASALAADFLRAPDWTLLVEDGQLALAMGDEPLAAYVALSDAPAMLRGPDMREEVRFPEELRMADAIACLEVAGDRCGELEGDGPVALGCRELQWGICVEQIGPPPVDPVERAAWITAGRIRLHALVLRYCEAMVVGASEDERTHADALRSQARTQANEMVSELRRDGPLPETDPHLAELLSRLGQS